MRRRKKNYWPILIINIFLWIMLGLLILLVEPNLVKDTFIKGAYLPFIILWWLANFLSWGLIFKNFQRGFLWAGGLTVLVILQIYDLGNVLSWILIGGIVVALEKYLSR